MPGKIKTTRSTRFTQEIIRRFNIPASRGESDLRFVLKAQ